MKKALINYMKNEKYDIFYTPNEAINPIIDLIDKELIIWECCDDTGDSNITKTFRERGNKVITTGIKENFLTFKPPFNWDIIITNPPYSLKDEFLKKCFEYGKPFLLLPITALEGKQRGKLFRKYGINVIVLDKRTQFIKGKQVYFNTSWFYYRPRGKNDEIIFKEV